MRARHSQLTEKYRSFRLKPDPTYLSRFLQTKFNKFIKRGLKVLSRRQLFSALRAVRCALFQPGLYASLLRLLRGLHITMVVIPRRKGKQILSVPVPIRRNKRDTINLQLLYRTVRTRHERRLADRFKQELLDLLLNRPQATTHRLYESYYATAHDAMVDMEYRWK